MPTHLHSVVVDTRDPRLAARWWSAAVGWPISYDTADEAIVEPVGDELEDVVPALVFGLGLDEKRVKNRVHLDLASASVDEQRATIARLKALGASTVDIGQGDVSWEVLADPDGNELCVLAENTDGGPLAAICLDAVDPIGLADFWASATGWTITTKGEDGVRLESPSGRLPALDLLSVPEPHTTKNRVHLDVAPPEDGDQAAEVERLIGLGATRVDVGQGSDATWVVLADPEGNEFCVLSPRPARGLAVQS
jgi:Glyoxalase-like domain